MQSPQNFIPGYRVVQKDSGFYVVRNWWSEQRSVCELCASQTAAQQRAYNLNLDDYKNIRQDEYNRAEITDLALSVSYAKRDAENDPEPWATIQIKRCKITRRWPSRIQEPDINFYRTSKRCEIEVTTDKLIRLGFDFGGKHFKLRPEDLLNYTSVKVGTTNPDPAIAFPVYITSVDGTVMQFNNASEYSPFVKAVADFQLLTLGTGVELYARVNAATTPEKVEEIVDPRV